MSVRMAVTLAMYATLAWSTAASAAVLLNDTFAVDGALTGQIPSPGPGVAWNPGAGGGLNAIQVVGGQAVLIQTDGGTNGEDNASVFADQPATGTTYARFDFRIPAADNVTLATDPDATEGVFFLTLRGTSASMSQRPRFGLLPPTGATGFRVAINADSSDLSAGGIWATDLAFDTTYRAVISYSAATGASQFWLNPASEASTSVSHTGAAATVINRVILRQATDYAGKQLVDNLVVATTFAEALSGGGSTNFLSADFNKSGQVDGADLGLLTGAFGSGAGGDADGDLDTDGADFLLWQRQLGQPQPPVAAAAAAVPEPGAGLLAIACVVAMLPLRRARRG